MRIQWHLPGESKFQTGVDRGVLFPRDNLGGYLDGVAWNGLTNVTESPSGAESNKQYADNKVYVNLKSAEEFSATIEALWAPKEFDACDGSASPVPGVYFAGQSRQSFGFSWCGLIGDEIVGTDRGRRMHFAYGCDAAPSEKANATVNESPEAAGLSWEVSTNPISGVEYDGVEYKPIAHVYVDSTEVTPEAWAALEAIVYGDENSEARLPTPAEIAELVGDEVTTVNLALAANQPSFVAGTGVITLPNVTGVQWKVNGQNKAAGAQPPLASGQEATVTAQGLSGFVVDGDDDWTFERP